MDFFRFLLSKRFLKHLVAMIVILAGLVWVVLFFLRIYTQHGTYYVVPDYSGKTLAEIALAPESARFNFVVIDSVFDLTRPKGSILHQDPYPGSKVKENRKIYLTVISSVPEKTSMPDLKFLTLRQAINTLESVGLKSGKIYYIPAFDDDAVQQQRFDGNVILPGTRLDKGSKIDLTVGMGAKGHGDVKEPEVPQDSM